MRRRGWVTDDAILREFESQRSLSFGKGISPELAEAPSDGTMSFQLFGVGLRQSIEFIPRTRPFMANPY